MFDRRLRAVLVGIGQKSKRVRLVGDGSSGIRTFLQFWAAVSLLAIIGACAIDREPNLEKGKLQKRPSSFPESSSSISVDISSIETESSMNRAFDDGPEGEANDEDGSLPTFRLYIEEKAWDELHDDVYADVTVPASVFYRARHFDIGLEIQGSTSRKFAKKSYKFKFNKSDPLPGNPFSDDGRADSYDKLFLKAMYKDNSRIREAIAFDLWRWMGGIAPRVGMARLYINDDYWGLYAVVEPIDKDFLEKNGYSRDGNLYKAVRRDGERADFRPSRDIKIAFEKRTNSGGSWNDLFDLVEILQTTRTNEKTFMEDIDPIFPLEAYLERMIWVSYTQNTDAVSQNFFLYSTMSEGKPLWHTFPWDSNACLGNHWSTKFSKLEANRFLILDGGNHFSKRVMRVESLREQYIDMFEDRIENLFTNQRIRRLLNHYFDLVEDELDRDLERWHRDTSARKELEKIEEYFDERPESLLEALAEYRETGKFIDNK